MRSERWQEITPSQFPHEAAGLNLVKALLPDVAPFRAWSNFEFRDAQGKWHEVDLLVLGRRRLHLVELKHYYGILRGNDHTWLRDGQRATDSPLLLARRKAQRLKSKLEEAFAQRARRRGYGDVNPAHEIPFIAESVFLHHEHFTCALPSSARMGLYGIDGRTDTSGLPGISDRLLESATPQSAVAPRADDKIADIMKDIGVVARRQREAGSWIIDEDPLAEGDGWQDWPAFHRVATTDRGRIRFFVSTPGASKQDVDRRRTLAEHEFRVMSRLAHDALVRPKDIVDNDLGVGLVYEADERYQRLDLWLADQQSGVPVEHQLAVARQVAEAVGYAHGNKVVHRGLTPAAVFVRAVPGGVPRVKVGDWQSSGLAAGAAGSAGGSRLTQASIPGVTSLFGAEAATSAGTTGSISLSRINAAVQAQAETSERRAAEAFQAPEGVWNPDADRYRLDVFALGALTYYLVSGRAPASDRNGLRERLRRDEGLDLAADLPQVPSAVRALVLAATRPAPSDRLPDVAAFLEKLADAERRLDTSTEVDVDPLEATPGSIIDGRFELVRRLGAGSTAVGLLVKDLSVAGGGPEAERVLKVALDDAAAGRLDAEAEVLKGLKNPRLVRMIAGPLDLAHGRRALLLEFAGDKTLADALRERPRLSLDLLERWGTDLLEAVVALDRNAVDHRDIKPANLGVRENRGDRVRHLVLFDFSLTRAAASALTAGTPPYLDPFLGSDGRTRYDSAAERYAAAVVLFEMATGATPVYREPGLDPASITDEATVEPHLFDPAVADAFVRFFRRALARKATARFDTATEMLTAWQRAFQPLTTQTSDDAEARAAAADTGTLLTESGLSARALSAVEPLGVRTVGDLVALDNFRLNNLRGVSIATRKEVTDRADQWRQRLRGTGEERPAGGETSSGPLPAPATAAAILVARAGGPRALARRAAARLLLGLDAGLDAFASQAELAAALEVTRNRATQQVSDLQAGWAADPECRDLLEAVAVVARQALADLGGVATVDELTDAVLTASASTPADTAADGAPAPTRLAAGLLRLALDAAAAGADTAVALNSRRRGGRIALLADRPSLLDTADALGRTADDLVKAVADGTDPLVPEGRAATALRDVVRRLVGDDAPVALLDGGRVLRLASTLSERAALSGSRELHDRDLTQVAAIRIALAGIGGTVAVSPKEVRERVRARFPVVAALPERDLLDQLVLDAGLDLVYDPARQVYRAPVREAETTGLLSRGQTVTAVMLTPAERGHIGRRLRESAAARSFLALAVEMSGRPVTFDRAVEALRTRHGATVLDLTNVLVEALRAQASTVGIPWEAVRAADAAQSGTRDAQGLAALVERAVPTVDAAIESALAAAGGPVLLTEAAPLARYDKLAALSRWSDITTRRAQALWLLVPQLAGNHGPVVDGRPIPLGAPGQFVRLDGEWLNPVSASAGVGPAGPAGQVDGGG